MERFAKNLIIVINSFFEYGFLQKGPESRYYVEHYWDLISKNFSFYSSVSYINEQLASQNSD